MAREGQALAVLIALDSAIRVAESIHGARCLWPRFRVRPASEVALGTFVESIGHEFEALTLHAHRYYAYRATAIATDMQAQHGQAHGLFPHHLMYGVTWNEAVLILGHKSMLRP